MTTPYTHPSMPGTRYLSDSIPGHVTASPANPSPWLAVGDAIKNGILEGATRPPVLGLDIEDLVIEDALLQNAYGDPEGLALVQAIIDRKTQESA